MNLQELDLSKTINDHQVYDCIITNYSKLSKHWILHQWNWVNNLYAAFNDHYKYLIIISLVEKTLQFYDQVNIGYSYDEYYSKSYLEIEKFSITELCEKLRLPKETIRRKVLELEKEEVIKRSKKKLIIDRKAFNFIKPENQIKFSSKYIYLVAECLKKEKIFQKKIDHVQIEKVIKKKFTLCWRWFYRMQIPLVINYKDIMKDITTFHIWGTICMNQVYNVSNLLDTVTLDHESVSDIIIRNNENESKGISAMSISEMTNIPRATIIRKCKFLIKKDLVKVNNKKQFILTASNFNKTLPYQKNAFKDKSKFIRKILNLLVIL